MSLRPGESPGNAVAVFPYLKTTDPIRLGSFTFRSTDDIGDLDAEDATHVLEIAAMLFLQDDLRILAASYAVLPALDLEKDEDAIREELERIQAVIAYCYSAPRHTFGDLFFHFEHASLAIFSPEPVTTFLVRPDHHVVVVGDTPPLSPDEWHRVPGYQGRYNFLHPFWVTRGSRLYPPVPHITLNHGQNLAYDLESAFREAPQHRLLPILFHGPKSGTQERALTAIKWYNRANSYSVDDSEAILSLAIGFEALLALPKDAKTDRFVDAVSLLLGRVPRLNLWAEQFYTARSDVAHEGRTVRLRLKSGKAKGEADAPLYQSLLSYGRQIFQLCVGAMLFGAHLAERAGLEEKLVTNQERFETICKTLRDEALAPPDRFRAIDDVVARTSEFRYVNETGLRFETMLGSAQAAAKALLDCNPVIESVVLQCASSLASAKRSNDWHDVFDAVHSLHEAMGRGSLEPGSPEGIVRRLLDVVWHYTFMHYFWLRERKGKAENV
jgi:hypothetical protein